MDYHELIDDYIFGRLNQEQKSAFESALSSDQSLQEELEFRKNIKPGYRALETAEIKNQIKSAIGEKPQTIKTAATKNKFNWWWLAIIPLLFMLGYFVGKTIKGNTVDNEAIYAEFYEPKLKFDRTRNTASHKSMEQVLYEMYQSKDHEGLYDAMIKVPEKRMTKDFRFIKAIAANNFDKQDEALAVLEEIIDEKDPIYLDQAIWTKVMIFIKSDRVEEAKEILNDLVKNDSRMNEKAKDLLSKL